jgi:hypothetical protein
LLEIENRIIPGKVVPLISVALIDFITMLTPFSGTVSVKPLKGSPKGKKVD